MTFAPRTVVGCRLITLAALTLGGCAAEPGEHVQSFEHGFMYDPTSLWTSHVINVCFETSGFSTEKTWLREVLHGQGSWEDAGSVNFVGFLMCSASAQGIRVRLNSAPDASSFSEQGPNFDSPANVVRMTVRVNPGLEVNCAEGSINTYTREQCFKHEVLHEFGHALGLYHEHQRLFVDTLPAGCETRGHGLHSESETRGTYDTSSIMNYASGPCQPRRNTISSLDARGIDALYGRRDGATNRLADFDGDGRSDLLCHDATTGTRQVSLASGNGQFDLVNWTSTTPAFWCAGNGEKLFKGDFDGDGFADLLCHNIQTGAKALDRGADGIRGTNWFRNLGFCVYGSGLFSAFGELHVGDFNADGRDDLMCRDKLGTSRVFLWARETGTFPDFVDYHEVEAFCDAGANLHMGDFNGDGRSDLLCHDPDDGTRAVDFANSDAEFGAANWVGSSSFCGSESQELFVGDFNGDGRDDLLCHDWFTGGKDIDYAASGAAVFGTRDWFTISSWCAHSTERLYVGDVNADGRDDLVCHNVENGRKWLDLASSTGRFLGQDNSENNDFCSDDRQIMR